MSVTATELHLLERLGDDYLSCTELATALDRSYGSAYASLVSLEKKGYVRAVGSQGKEPVRWTRTAASTRVLRESRRVELTSR